LSGSSHEDELQERLFAFSIRRTKYDDEVGATVVSPVPQVVRVEGQRHGAERAAVEVAVTALREGRRAIVFCYYRETASRLRNTAIEQAEVEGIDPSVVVMVTGESSAACRIEVLREIEDHPERPVLLIATIDSVGMGLRLATFDVAAFSELHYVPTRILQAMERIWDLEKKAVCDTYFCVVKGSDDEHVADIVVDKLGQIERILGVDRMVTDLTTAMRDGSGGGQAVLNELVAELQAIEASA